MNWKRFAKYSYGLVLALPLAASAQLQIGWLTINGGGTSGPPLSPIPISRPTPP